MTATADADEIAGETARRTHRFQQALRREKLDHAIVFDRPNAFYLTGFHSSLSFLLVPREGTPTLLVDGRYEEAARRSVPHCEVVLFKKLGDSLDEWRKARKPARVGFEGSIPHDRVKEFEKAIPGVEWVECGKLLRDLRVVKSPFEIARLAASAATNDRVFEAAVRAAASAPDEIAIRNAIRAEADRLGAAGLSFDCIVASGTTGSMPHYVPSDHPVSPGDLLLIDLGVVVDHYCSDMTRVVHIGGKKPHPKMQRAFDAVLEAEEAALAAVGPDVPTKRLHEIATEALKKHRLAKYFTHGLGHGVGLEIHEAPRLNDVSEEILRPGMAITIEPGVYLPGVGGVRIEDLVVVTKNGCRVLSRSPKTFRTVERV